MMNRVTMERLGQLPKRISVLEEDFDEDQLEAEAGNAAAAAVRLFAPACHVCIMSVAVQKGSIHLSRTLSRRTATLLVVDA